MDRKGQLEKEDNEFIEIAIITLSVDFVHCLSPRGDENTPRTLLGDEIQST
jgi:hypothetical protein